MACSVNKSGAFEFVQLLLIPKRGVSGLISWWEGKVGNPHLDQRRVCGAAVNSPTPSSAAQPSPHVVPSQKKEQQINNVVHFLNYIFTKRATNNQLQLNFYSKKTKNGIYLLAHLLKERLAETGFQFSKYPPSS